METTYQTMFYDPSTQEVTFWCDIYNKSTNNIQSLVQLIGEHEIFFGQDDKQAIERNIAKIDGELREANPYIQKIIDQGKDPKDEIYRLNRTIPTSELV